MIDRLLYYVDLLIALCGFDGTDEYTVFGWIVVTISMAIVIYACYEAFIKTFWPGETDKTHIKYRILTDNDEDVPHAH